MISDNTEFNIYLEPSNWRPIVHYKSCKCIIRSRTEVITVASRTTNIKADGSDGYHCLIDCIRLKVHVLARIMGTLLECTD